ncbi:hypothetical protein [Edaphocola flava]|jgi:hypothetical protein|uniref:hypothetical protein n=1 Tax=Edaphocola flava TaxID=2499629 RepID=UPI00100B7A94|nr:hypothetical protein [Edaphocola flava]
MKKFLMAAVLSCGAFVTAQANSLTIINLTSCTFRCGVSWYGDVMAAPGTTTINSIGQDLESLKMEWLDVTGTYRQLVSGITLPNTNSLGMPAPACPVPNGFITLSWAQASLSANATMVIF